jgi:Trk K+ transport system NAD-binding subunit
MYLLDESETRQNLRALAKFGGLLAGTVALFTVLFHAIMAYEGQTQHSWLTGFYWTLTVMSTLGFGDITFQSDVGRAFTILVLVYGIVMLLIVAPFTFIRFFYAPWLEAQVRLRAPRAVAPDLAGHVILCGYDEMIAGLIDRLTKIEIPYVVIEPNPAEATRLHGDGVQVITGPRDHSSSYEAARAAFARLVVANLGDAENSNVTLTIREVAPGVPIVALAANPDSVDVLELSGADQVLLLKQRLGDQLATRVGVGTQSAHRIGRFEDLIIAEFPVTGTALVGRTIRESHLRQLTGLNIVAVWERGRLSPTGPDTVLTKHCVPVVVGTEEQITELDALFVIYQDLDAPVIVIGGGTVGRAVAASLRAREATVTILEQDPSLEAELSACADRVIIGDASNLERVKAAGIDVASSVVLTTNNDATNIFLAIYCRKLNPDAHIVSRITNDWNLEAIHRAGTDSALSEESVAVQTLLSHVLGGDLVVMGEGNEVFFELVPERLAGLTLAESGIGGETGLAVVAIRTDGSMLSNPTGATELHPGAELVMIGNADQRRQFQAFATGA